MKRVLVLLSTYNGEDFLGIQLRSLYNQEGIDIHILVRDDGSTDSTTTILNQFCKEYGKMTILKEKNVGPALSFYLLLKKAWDDFCDYDYYAFCDQDDEWDSNKLFSGVEKLEQSDNPFKFYGCKFRVIDANGIVIENCSPTFQEPNYKNCLFRNPTPGCSQIFSRGLLERSIDVFKYIESADFSKTYLHLHDVWTINLACYLDAYIYIDKRPLFSYRQHSSNVTIYSEKSYLRRYKGVINDLKRTPQKYSHGAKILLDLEKGIIGNEKIKYLQMVADYRKTFISTFCFAVKYPWVHKQLYVKVYAFISIIFRLF